jgi:hypothetical protein
MMLACVPRDEGTLNIYGDQSSVVYGQPALDLSATDSAGLTRHSLSSSIRLLFFATRGAALDVAPQRQPDRSVSVA